MNPLRRYNAVWLLLLCWSLCAGHSHAVEVVAEGKAPGSTPNAREQALTDALREAVRKGVGVDLLSQTKVTDFVLDYDRVTAAAFGHVRNFEVVSSRLGTDGIYRVQVKAEVSPGTPGLQDVLALRQIVNLKRSPRVALEVDELIEGVPAGADIAKGWFESAVREMQLNLVDVKRVDRESARRKVVGEAQQADFILQAKVRARHVGSSVLRGTPTQRFSLAADLRALRPDMGQVLVAIALPTEEVDSFNQSVEGAARQLIHAFLKGDEAKRAPGGWTLFRKVMANWLVEVDLGAITRLEFTQITDSDFDRLQKALAETPKISAVWPREFDGKALSSVDVETRLDVSGIKSEVLKALENKFALDRATPHYLQFVRAPQVVAPSHSTVAVAASAPAKAGGAPGVTAETRARADWPWASWGWLETVAVVLVVLFVGGLIGRKVR